MKQVISRIARRRPVAPLALPLSLFATLPACAELAGLGEYDTTGTGGTATTSSTGGTTSSTGGTTSSTGGTGGTASTGGTSSTGGTGGTTSSAGGTTSSTGGTATGGSTSTGTPTTECTPLTSEPCFTGPEAAAGVGACAMGVRSCDAAGTWGVCIGDVLPKVEICATPSTDESCDNLAACAGAFRWSRLYGSPGSQTPSSIASWPDGSVVVVGQATGALTFGSDVTMDQGGTDAFMVRLDRDGKVLWSKRFGDAGGGNQYAPAVAVDALGNVVVAGTSDMPLSLGGDALAIPNGTNNAFVARFAPDGTHLWSKIVGDPAGGLATSVAVDANGDVVVAGRDLQSPTHPWIDKRAAATGDPVWAAPKLFTATDATTTITRVLVYKDGAGANGDIVITGYGKGGTNFGAGAQTVAGGAGNDVFVARFTKDGNLVWSHPYGSPADDAASWDMALIATGAAVVIGNSPGDFALYNSATLTGTGTLDVIVFRAGPGGNTNWAMRLGEAGNQWGTGIAADAADNIVFTGAYDGTITIGPTVLTTGTIRRFFAKMNATQPQVIPIPVFATSFAAGDLADAKLATDALGNIAYASLLRGTIDLGGGPLSSAAPADSDILIGAFTP